MPKPAESIRTEPFAQVTPMLSNSQKALFSAVRLQAQAYKAMMRCQIEALSFMRHRLEEDVRLVDEIATAHDLGNAFEIYADFLQQTVSEYSDEAGKLANLEQALREAPLTGGYGIGHTRWATHGRPTEENAHPHRDPRGRGVLVHNGIIENYLELKKELQGRGIVFRTETDTEVVAHLVGLELREDGLHAAVTRALARLHGLFALVVISSTDPGTIVAVRNGPPVVVGLGDQEYFVASDIPAILAHTRDVVFLEDGQVAVLRREGVAFFDAQGLVVTRTPQRITWDPVMAEKAGYKHFMLKEIFEQPWAIKETLVGRLSVERGDVHLPETNLDDEALAGISRVVLLACGTSWHAALVGKFLIEQLGRVPVEVDYGSEYRYRPVSYTHSPSPRDTR